MWKDNEVDYESNLVLDYRKITWVGMYFLAIVKAHGIVDGAVIADKALGEFDKRWRE